MAEIKDVLRVKFERANDTGLKPAAELAEKSAELYPNDSEKYRIARKALLVAKQRRALLIGGTDWCPKLEYSD